MGLGSYWGEVMKVLEEIIPVYDKVNSIISLGKDGEHRNRGISQRVFPGNKILDAGSGFGNMSKTALKQTDGKISVTLFDPLIPMLKNTSMHFEKSPNMANGVSLIIAGIDQKGESIYVTDPSGTYVQYAAVAIGAGSDDVNEFLEKHYTQDMSIDDIAALAISAINLKDDQKDGIDDIKMAKITTKSKVFETVSESALKNYSQNVSKFASE